MQLTRRMAVPATGHPRGGRSQALATGNIFYATVKLVFANSYTPVSFLVSFLSLLCGDGFGGKGDVRGRQEGEPPEQAPFFILHTLYILYTPYCRPSVGLGVEVDSWRKLLYWRLQPHVPLLYVRADYYSVTW